MYDKHFRLVENRVTNGAARVQQGPVSQKTFDGFEESDYALNPPTGSSYASALNACGSEDDDTQTYC